VNELLALAVAAFAIDGLLWGFAAFFVFRLLGGRRRWWLGIAGATLLALAQEAFVFLPLVGLLDLRIGNAELADLIGTDRMVDLFTFDPLSEVLITAFAVATGFVIAGFLDERRARRSAGVAPEGGTR